MVEEFYIIVMKLNNGKKLYLKCTNSEKRLEWTADKEEACWFNFEDEAEKFAKSYFKNFTEWFVEGFNYDISKAL